MLKSPNFDSLLITASPQVNIAHPDIDRVDFVDVAADFGPVLGLLRADPEPVLSPERLPRSAGSDKLT